MDPKTAIAQVDAAAAEGKLSPTAAKNVLAWLTEPYLAEYAVETAAQVAAGKWKELDDAFWTIIPFGTGGRRGKMYPIGPNAINDRTIGESALGLAEYVKQQVRGKPLSCAIAYDTRHRSREFAELCAGIMAAAGFQVYFLDGYRSTPELSFAVRYKRCDCGIIITASHNPPADNAVKVYWSTGGQLLPPHDEECIDCVQRVTWIEKTPFAEGVRSGKIVFCQQEVDAAFIAAVLKQSVPGPRDSGYSIRRFMGWASRRCVRRWRGPAFATSRFSPRTPRRTAIFPTFPSTSPTRKTPPCSTQSLSAASRSGPT